MLSEDWVYRVTHPAFEDSSTGYGYLTWLNAKNDYGFSVLDMQIPSIGVPIMPGPCAPVSIYEQHPHGLSTASDCGYGIGFSCAQTYDVGVWHWSQAIRSTRTIRPASAQPTAATTTRPISSPELKT